MTNVGAWNQHYLNLTEPHRYGDLLSYQMAAAWMIGCATVEDWGCGGGFLRQFIDPDAYVGVDGSCSPFADRIDDLVTYRSEAEGIVLRHVLEHDMNWELILENALASARKRLFIALFTPLRAKTEVLMVEPDYRGVPVIGFRLSDLTDKIDADYTVETIPGSAYGVETLIRVSM